MSKFYWATRSMLLILLIVGFASAQTPPPSKLVTIPTAGTIQRGTYEVEMLMQTGGGVLGRLEVGFSDQFSIGMSYGIQKFIGSEEMALNRSVPEAQLKYRLFDETVKMPAIAIGLDTQGRGIFQDKSFTVTDTTDGIITNNVTNFERYEIKAIGVYLILSKNWEVLGNMGSHFGISKNMLEENVMDKDINFFFGVDKDLSSQFSVFAEYNAALDDNDYNSNEPLEGWDEITFGKGKGYLNAGLRWNIATTFYLELDINDIMVNRGNVDFYTRELKVVFNDFF